MTVTATIVDGVFTISGESEAEQGRFVYANRAGFAFDNFVPPDLFEFDFIGGPPDADGATFNVPVDSDGSAVELIDVSGVVGAGVVIDRTNGAGVIGSEQGDIIQTSGAGPVSVQAGGGDDTVLGGDDEIAVFDGGIGDDLLIGAFRDDTLTGGEGDDSLGGGSGFDIAVYSGNRADYEITTEDGRFVVTDLRGGSPDGTDVVANIERLQFADQTLDLGADPTGLTAAVVGDVLTVSGQAASGEFSVVIDRDRVFDGGDVPLQIREGGSDIRTVDASGVQGSGVQIFHVSFGAGPRVFGSEQADEIFGLSFGGQRGVLLGRGGDDTIVGAGDNMYLSGGAGDDSLVGTFEADATFVGGLGDDTIEGDEDFDVAIYSGNMADYVLTFEDGAYVLTDTRPGDRDGVDVLKGIEQLQFADGVMDMPAPPSDLEATLNGGVLKISGEAASSDAFVRVDTVGPTVFDSANPAVAVAIDGDGSVARTIDARGVTGAGVSIEVESNVRGARVFGSAQDDNIEIDSGGSSRTIVKGGQGHDVISGSTTRDDFSGGFGDDTLSGASGADTLTGNQGQDLIDGGSDIDVAVYSGSSANYLVEQVYDYFRVTDLRGRNDGVDLIVNVEQLKFSDGTFDVATLVSPPPPDDALIA